MKFSTYEPAVNPNTLHNIDNVQQRVSRDLHVYGPQGGGEQWQALGQLAKIGMEMHQKAIDGKVLEANAEYNKLMSEGTTQLMQKKEGEALNITEDYDKLQKNVLGEVKKKYGGYIGWGSGAEAFNAYTMRDDATRREHMVKYQMAETDKYHETQFNNQLASCQEFVIGGGGTDAAIEEGYNRGVGLLQSRYANYGPEKVKEQERIFKGQLVASALQMAINAGDYARMDDMCNKYSKYIDPKTLVTVKGMNMKRNREEKEFAQAQTLLDKFGLNATFEDVKRDVIENWARNHADGTNYKGSNAEAWKEAQWVEKQTGLPAAFIYRQWAHESAYFSSQLARENNNFGGLTQVEWNGDDNLQPDGNNYYREFKNFHEYAEAYVKDFINLYEGTENVRTLADFAHYLKNNDYYGADEADYLAAMERVDMEIDGTEDNSQPTDLQIEEETERIWSLYQKEYQRVRTAENRLIEQGQLEQQNLINQGVNDPDAFDAIANKYGITNGVVNDRVLITLQKQGGHIRNIMAKEAEREAQRASGSGGSGGSRGGKENDPLARIAVREMLESGIPVEEVLEHIDSHNYSNAKDLLKMVFDYKDGKGEFAVDWKPLKAKAKSQFGGDDFEAQWALAQDYAYEQYKQYKAAHGDNPTQKEMEGWLFDGFTHPEYTTHQGTFWDSTEKSALSKAEWYNRGVTDVFYNPSTRTYSVTLANGGTYQLTPEQYNAIVEEGKRADQVLFGGYN